MALLCVLHNTIISPSPHKDAYLHMTDSTTPESRQDIRKHSSKRPLPSSPARLSNVKPRQYQFFEFVSNLRFTFLTCNEKLGIKNGSLTNSRLLCKK